MRDERYSALEIATWTGHSVLTQQKTYAHVWAELRGTGDAEQAIYEARGGERSVAV